MMRRSLRYRNRVNFNDTRNNNVQATSLSSRSRETLLNSPYIGKVSFRGTFLAQAFERDLEDTPKEQLARGGKINLPQSVLRSIARFQNFSSPILFKVTYQDRISHCGVNDFTSDDNKVQMPPWFMENLGVVENILVEINYVDLPKGEFVKLQPKSVDFLDISDQRAVLERNLRSFSCLTEKDVIRIDYNDKKYELIVLATRPSPAIKIIECDLDVDFAPPLIGYEDPLHNCNSTSTTNTTTTSEIEIPENLIPFQAFQGSGFRMDGKLSLGEKEKTTTTTTTGKDSNNISNKKKNSSSANGSASGGSGSGSGGNSKNKKSSAYSNVKRGIPDFNHDVYTLQFKRKSKNKRKSSGSEVNGESAAAEGGGKNSLKAKKSKTNNNNNHF